MARHKRGKSANAVFADSDSTTRIDANRQIVEKSLPENRRRKHRQHTLVSRLSRIRRGDPIDLDQIRNPCQQHRQQKNNHCQSALRVFHRRLAKRLHPVAHRFHASQRRAPAGENFQQQPVTSPPPSLAAEAAEQPPASDGLR